MIKDDGDAECQATNSDVNISIGDIPCHEILDKSGLEVYRLYYLAECSIWVKIPTPQDDFLIGGANVKDNENHWKGKDGPCNLLCGLFCGNSPTMWLTFNFRKYIICPEVFVWTIRTSVFWRSTTPHLAKGLNHPSLLAAKFRLNVALFSVEIPNSSKSSYRYAWYSYRTYKISLCYVFFPLRSITSNSLVLTGTEAPPELMLRMAKNAIQTLHCNIFT